MHGNTRARVLAQHRGHWLISDGPRLAVARRLSESPVTGDWVGLDAAGVISAICERHGTLTRLDPGGGSQVLAANVDLALIVEALPVSERPPRGAAGRARRVRWRPGRTGPDQVGPVWTSQSAESDDEGGAAHEVAARLARRSRGRRSRRTAGGSTSAIPPIDRSRAKSLRFNTPSSSPIAKAGRSLVDELALPPAGHRTGRQRRRNPDARPDRRTERRGSHQFVGAFDEAGGELLGVLRQLGAVQRHTPSTSAPKRVEHRWSSSAVSCRGSTRTCRTPRPSCPSSPAALPAHRVPMASGRRRTARGPTCRRAPVRPLAVRHSRAGARATTPEIAPPGLLQLCGDHLACLSRCCRSGSRRGSLLSWPQFKHGREHCDTASSRAARCSRPLRILRTTVTTASPTSPRSRCTASTMTFLGNVRVPSKM